MSSESTCATRTGMLACLMESSTGGGIEKLHALCVGHDDTYCAHSSQLSVDGAHYPSQNLTLDHFRKQHRWCLAFSIRLHRPLSLLNLSHASFSVLNTAALTMRCSVLASCGICNHKYQHWSIPTSSTAGGY